MRTDNVVARADLVARAISLRGGGRDWSGIAAELGVSRQRLDRMVRAVTMSEPVAELGTWRATETEFLLSERRSTLEAKERAAGAGQWSAVAQLSKALTANSRELRTLLGVDVAPPPTPVSGPTVNVINVDGRQLPGPVVRPGMAEWDALPRPRSGLTVARDSGTVDGSIA